MAGASTHATLEDLRADDSGRPVLERDVQSYELFPALWAAEYHAPGLDIVEEGLGFPVEARLRSILR